MAEEDETSGEANNANKSKCSEEVLEASSSSVNSNNIPALENKTIESSDVIAVPPDGGWGWMVVFASFVAHLIADGCSLSFGVLFTELLDVFEESKSKTAWVGSLFISMPSICGPFASILVNKYGCRRTTMVGGLLAAAGCVASAFVNSIDMLCITFGIISGFGLALVFIPAVLVVNFYFKKRRSCATGIAVAGSGIGIFIFAPLTEVLIQEYTWRGALVIIGGLMLNLVICAALFRPLVKQPSDDVDNQNQIIRPKPFLVTSTRFSFMSPQSSIIDGDMKSNGEKQLDLLQPRFILNAQICDGDCVCARPVNQSLIQFPTFYDKDFDGFEPEILCHLQLKCQLMSEIHTDCDLGKALDNVNNVSRSPVSINLEAIISETNIPLNRDITCEPINSSSHLEVIDSNKNLVVHYTPDANSSTFNSQTNQFYRKEIFYQCGLLRARFLLGAGQSSSCPDIYIHARKKQKLKDQLKELTFSKTLAITKKFFRTIFDFRIFKSVIFNYFCLHCMLLNISYNNPYVYIPDHATSHGIKDDAASTLVAIIGIAGTVGQVVMGFVGDRPQIDTFFFYIAMTSLAGIITLLVPLFMSFTLLAVYCALYGFFINANYCLTPVILVNLLGLEQLTSAFGMVSFAAGIAVLVGPPFAGWLSDATGSYEATFYSSGVVILISGFMLFAVPFLHRRLRNKSTATTITTTTEVNALRIQL